MKKLLGIIGMVFLLFACGTTGKQHSAKQNLANEERDTLSYEQRRKYNYFFLEAVRLKQKGEYDAAFELYKHCLDIYPGSAPALYEISQFYMVLGQEQKGEEALKKAVRSDESNFWYKQTLAAYYQRKRDWAKAIAVYDDMAHQFPSRLEPLMALVDLYNQTKSYAQVVSVLNRLEELDGKSEQISMEKFRMYLLMDNQEQAFNEIESLSKEYPYDLRYQTILGDVFLSCDKHRFRQFLVVTGDFNLLSVFGNFFKVVVESSELLKFLFQVLFHLYGNLVGAFCDDANSFIHVAGVL